MFLPPEWRAGVAGHLILSDEDLTSVVQGSWKRLNTLQHYKVREHPTKPHQPKNCTKEASLEALQSLRCLFFPHDAGS